MSHTAPATVNWLRKTSKAFMADERGSTAIEYSLIAGIIFLAIVGSVSAIGQLLQSELYEPVSAGLSNAISGG